MFLMKKKKELAVENVKVTKTTKKRLEDYRIADGETFNSVIKRLLEKASENGKDDKEK